MRNFFYEVNLLNVFKEINYKISQRHNNFVYKSKDESSWHLHQVNIIVL